eukprot:TRINITY_DN15130_c0_g1_i1.p1 TRINITY_DN15130_c0_g1~~TRINITY_DN15130_c0_g1_i1.p1  ORF type:complete len:315 (+),score=64.24 TRINITY_DN15130_c0_g1_i1:61-945(+)
MYEKSKETNKLIAAKVGRLEREVKDIRRKYERAKEKLVNQSPKELKNSGAAVSANFIKDEVIDVIQHAMRDINRKTSPSDMLKTILLNITSIPVITFEKGSELHEIKTILADHRQRVLTSESTALKHKRALKKALREKSKTEAELSTQQSQHSKTINKYKEYLARYKEQLASAREEINVLRTRKPPEVESDASDWNEMERELTKEWRESDVENRPEKHYGNSMLASKKCPAKKPFKRSVSTPLARYDNILPHQTHPHERRYPTHQEATTASPTLNDDLIQLEKDLADLQRSLLN